MRERTIYNCHCHLFTHRHIPNGYLPLFLVPLARIEPVRRLLGLGLRGLVPWSRNDRLQRIAAFIDTAFRERQADNFAELAGYYPDNSRFVVLPMDLALMEAGPVPVDIDAQHAELAALAAEPGNRERLIPFAHIDPRREDALKRLRHWVETHRFRGLKIYPTLGYAPDHPRLMEEIYPYLCTHNLPLISHCSPGSVVNKRLGAAASHALADPDRYLPVLQQFPNLRLCLAHFGGIDEWRRQLTPEPQSQPTWLGKILQLMESGRYPNLYADIAYTIFNVQEHLPLLSVLLERPAVRERVLFGSDFYMVKTQRYAEKRLSIDLRHQLGEAKFWQIAETNPRRFLGE